MSRGLGDVYKRQLKHLKAQDWVNLEIDTIARYVERMIKLREDEGDDLF